VSGTEVHDVAAGPDAARLSRTLGDPALARVVRRLARRLELGRPLEAPLTLADATEAERLALGRLLGRPASLRGNSLRVSPALLSAALTRAGIAPDLRSAVEALVGPVTSRAEVTAAESTGRTAALAALAVGRHAGTPWYEQWAGSLQADGTLTRLVRSGSQLLIEQAVAVLNEVPADMLPLPALAERATGDTKALSATPLARLVLRALAIRQGGDVLGAPSQDGAEAGLRMRVLSRAAVQRALWESAGAIQDDMASQVLVLGVTAAPSHPLGRWLSEAAMTGTPFRVTLQQLDSMPIEPAADQVFVCENPSVLRAAVSSLGPGVGCDAGCRRDRTSLICTEGTASAACHRLLAALARTGAPVYWRGDFDWTGLRAVVDAIARYDARPWRMGLADYDAALAVGPTERLRGPAADSPWDPPLARRMAQTGRAVMEERLIPMLLADLSAGGPLAPRATGARRGRT
jgi:uncharacterized protein (TIGR02679 family)